MMWMGACLHTNVFCHFGFKMAVLQFMLKTIRGKNMWEQYFRKAFDFFKYLLITHKLGNNSNVTEMISLNWNWYSSQAWYGPKIKFPARSVCTNFKIFFSFSLLYHKGNLDGNNICPIQLYNVPLYMGKYLNTISYRVHIPQFTRVYALRSAT